MIAQGYAEGPRFHPKAMFVLDRGEVEVRRLVLVVRPQPLEDHLLGSGNKTEAGLMDLQGNVLQLAWMMFGDLPLLGVWGETNPCSTILRGVWQGKSMLFGGLLEKGPLCGIGLHVSA